LPQCATSSVRLASHPFVGLPSQSADPAGHEQRPFTHGPPPGHAAPQPPQFIESVRASTSQPSATLPLQSTKPSKHMFVQLPPLQVVPGHAASQLPQWCGSVVSETHDAPQHDCPAGQFEQPPSLSASAIASARGVSVALSAASMRESAVPSTSDA
jgi:hypothetical protein